MEEIKRKNVSKLDQIFEVRISGRELAYLATLDGFVLGTEAKLIEKLSRNAAAILGYSDSEGWVDAQEDLGVVVDGNINFEAEK